MMRGHWAVRAGAFFLLAAATLATPFDGALGLAKILAWALYLCVLALPSPCRGGAAYPFRHGFRPGAACSVSPAVQRDEGTTSAGPEATDAPSTRLPSTRTAPDATSRSASG